MITLSLQLLPIPDDYKKTGAIPRGSIAYIVLKGSSLTGEIPVKSGKEKHRFTTLSSMCASSAEVVWEADRIIQELRIIKKQAKQFFEKEEEKRKQEE